MLLFQDVNLYENILFSKIKSDAFLIQNCSILNILEKSLLNDWLIIKVNYLNWYWRESSLLVSLNIHSI